MQITIHMVDHDQKVKVKKGTTLLQVLDLVGKRADRSILAAMVDNKMHELNSALEEDATVRLVTIDSLDGLRVYQRSASFLLIKAVADLYPERSIRILHSVANGLYCTLLNQETLTVKMIKAIEARMHALVKADHPFEREEVVLEKALALFKKSNKEDKARLLSSRTTNTASIYKLDGEINYFYGYLAPSTGYVRVFKLQPHADGMIMHLPSLGSNGKIIPAKKGKKFFEVFQEVQHWRSILEIDDVSSLNEVIRSERTDEFIMLAEAFHEKKIAQIADQICAKKDVRVVLLSGPSSSGKTTFTKRLAVQLRVNGKKPILISMDDYFIDREKTPTDAHGDHDFESPHALDIPLFKKHLQDIVDCKEVRLPRYDFKQGKSLVGQGHLITPTKESIIIIEGIHGLNPLFSNEIPRRNVFKLYVSPLTEVPLDRHNRIPTTDTRLLRRMVRDFQFRSYAANDTILRWPSVRGGETKHIFPFQEEADVLFNTALIYEIAVLKTMAEPLLREIPRTSRAYAEAKRLLKFLSYFQAIPVTAVPRHSILREFLGGSSFKY